MGGRGSSSGLKSSGFAKTQKEESFDKRFKRYDYGNRIIYKINNQYAIFDRKTNDIVRIDKTLKESKTAVDMWNEAVKRKKRKR